MRVSVVFIAAAIAVATSTAALASPYGTWTRPSTGTKVEFYDCGGKLCGKIVSSKNKDTIGKQIVSGASKTGENTWKGNLLNTEDGQTYNGVITLEGPKALNLQGCVLGGIVCKGETWVK